ncbi:DNase I-like protein [Cutaneotrichosporon oleaginosum]|uniref:DNase I-like protein n=1 Tax=Cutaneotrichosporon oleaginosum TaxID=879819 RepID=A0A0J0XKB0_9TREE|nr:DNase I-like protein [Cutaneotrichosporon oleaginosum]KLT41531.1 DNase I-like protein [Cutaneotrichosporon oleaginosum]TXT05820.1 hypothetical protein COLE_07140 [Cutaneotrichosporon oleaginosum]
MSSSSSESSIFKPPLPGNKPSAPTVVPMAEQRPALPQRPRGDSVSGVTIPTSGTPPPRRPARQATVHSVPTSAYSSPPPSHRQRGASISVEPGYDPPPPPPLRTAGHSSAAGLGRANTVSAASRLDVRRMNGGSASPGRTTSGADSDYDEDEGPAPALSSTAQRLLEEHPDSTYANKTAPVYGKRSTTVRPPHSITSFAVYSQYVAVGHSHVLVYDVTKSNDPILDMDQKEDTGFELRVKEPRITALGFRPSRDPTCEGRYLWCGNKDGHLWEIDIEFGRVTATKPGAHSSAVSHIMRHEYYILTLDDTGKLNVWEVPEPCDKGEAGNFRLFRTMRVSDRVTFAKMIKGKLWTATAPTVRSATTTAGVRGPTVRVYEPFVLGNAPPPRTNLTPEWTGSATSATVVPFKSDLVYIGHEGGFVSLWQLAGTELHCVQVLKVSTTDILALEGVGDHLWAGNRRGQIHVWNIDQQPWTTSNLWTVAKDDPIRALLVDPRAIPLQKRLPLWSVTRDTMSSWDGLRAVNWIEKRMIERQPDYCTFRDVKVLVVSWNIDSAKPSDLSSGGIDNVNFLSQVLGSVESPDIVVFGFQEVVPLTDKKLTAKTLLFGSKGKDGGGATNERVSGAYRAWADKLTSAIQLNIPGAEYMKLHSEQLVGLFTCVFTKNEEMLQQTIKDVVITTVKRGIGGIYGNKGAIVARMVLDDTSLCFINVHLAAGQRHKAARNADLAAIMENKDIFPKSAPQWFVHGGNGEAILDHEMVVLNGDLNYRIDQRRQVVESSILSGDLNYLLEYDQLRAEMRGNHAFRLRTFAEAPITFAPTYKYDPGTNEYDSSEKRRIPAWCDRVLFTKSPRISSISYRRYEVNVSDHRPVSAGLVCQVKSIDPVRCAIVRSEIEAAWKVYQEERLETMAKTYAGWY